MMDIKMLDNQKKIMEYFIDTLPLEQMEFDIQQSNDPLISKLYQSIISVDQQTIDLRYKNIYHKTGIIGIYSLFDVVYSDYLRWILFNIKDIDFQAKPPDRWRVNEIIEKEK